MKYKHASAYRAEELSFFWQQNGNPCGAWVTKLNEPNEPKNLFRAGGYLVNEKPGKRCARLLGAVRGCLT